jgi:hypothetical protein
MGGGLEFAQMASPLLSAHTIKVEPSVVRLKLALVRRLIVRAILVLAALDLASNRPSRSGEGPYLSGKVNGRIRLGTPS